MNRDRARELLPIIQAYANGEEIQWHTETTSWLACKDDEQFTYPCEYRIKPKPREFIIAWDDKFSDAAIYEEYEVGSFHAVDWKNHVKVREVL